MKFHPIITHHDITTKIQKDSQIKEYRIDDFIIMLKTGGYSQNLHISKYFYLPKKALNPQNIY